MRYRPLARRLPSRTSCSAFSHLEGSRLAERPSPPGAGSPHEPSRMHGWSYAAMASRSGIAATAIRATPGFSALCGLVSCTGTADGRSGQDRHFIRPTQSKSRRPAVGRLRGSPLPTRPARATPNPCHPQGRPRTSPVALSSRTVSPQGYIHTDDVRNPCAVYSSATRCEPVRLPYRLL